MSEFRMGTPLGKAKKFSNYRCVRCHSFLVPLTEEKMSLFNFTMEQKKRVNEHELTHFCPRCMRGYQRGEKPLGELANCPYCGEELVVTSYKGELTNVLYCLECEKGFEATDEELKKIEKLAEKSNRGVETS